jgi:DNA-binding GntR family transcriptional regulator
MKRSLDHSFREHETIFQAIEARDVETARVEMLRHVSYDKYYMLAEKAVDDLRFVAYEYSESGNVARA